MPRSRAGIGAGSTGSDEQRDFAALDDGNPPSAETVRQLRRLHASAVTVVTTHDPSGLQGITVSAFCVVSLSPARLLVCLASESHALAGVGATGSFAVSVLGDRQEFIADRFAGRAPLVNRRFDGVKHRLSRLGNPILEESLVWLDCRLDGVVPGGDHAVVFGNVVEAGYGTGAAPLLYFDGAYRVLESPP